MNGKVGVPGGLVPGGLNGGINGIAPGGGSNCNDGGKSITGTGGISGIGNGFVSGVGGGTVDGGIIVEGVPTGAISDATLEAGSNAGGGIGSPICGNGITEIQGFGDCGGAVGAHIVTSGRIVGDGGVIGFEITPG